MADHIARLDPEERNGKIIHNVDSRFAMDVANSAPILQPVGGKGWNRLANGNL
jgi:hypothetical protein